jgi:predicted nucleotidyltransferase
MPDAKPSECLEEALAGAALNDRERRAIARIVALANEELGDDLLGVWLYGSRARGEADPNETHYDRRSDIDMMAIIGPGRDVSAFKREFIPRMIDAVAAEGDSPPYYSFHCHELEWLVDRRRIRSFFFQEVDRDKIVLAGSALDGPEYR